MARSGGHAAALDRDDLPPCLTRWLRCACEADQSALTARSPAACLATLRCRRICLDDAVLVVETRQFCKHIRDGAPSPGSGAHPSAGDRHDFQPRLVGRVRARAGRSARRGLGQSGSARVLPHGIHQTSNGRYAQDLCDHDLPMYCMAHRLLPPEYRPGDSIEESFRLHPQIGFGGDGPAGLASAPTRSPQEAARVARSSRFSISRTPSAFSDVNRYRNAGRHPAAGRCAPATACPPAAARLASPRSTSRAATSTWTSATRASPTARPASTWT